MTDTPTPPPSASAPADPTPRRSGTILARLSQALREQNWFAVALEVVIVIVGVVIGFQVTALGQARSDAAKEQTYLRQLHADLHETLRLADEADSLNARGDRASSNSIRMFYLPETPPADSVIDWHVRSVGMEIVTPLLGTAEALISSGDLSLIRDDSLRAAITAYVTRSHQLIDDQALHYTEWRRSINTMMTRTGYAQHLDWYLTRDSSLANHPLWPGVIGPRRDPFALDVDDLLQDREAQTVINRILQSRLATVGNRQAVEAATEALKEQVEAEVTR
ncbi:hypothetical protein [Rubrivirga sp.]|uniref:hypothetical protein n=1 Tax=Rubrivirga sp. TaxID=1885344 RepID=UPI003C721C59